MPSGWRGAGYSRPPEKGGRALEHLLIGLGVTAAAVLASTLAARLSAPAEPELALPADQEPARPRRPALDLIWPPLFLALTVSGLRIWSAPKSPARTQALTLWGTAQGLNALWMALGPRRLGGPLAAAVASLGASAAYAWRARRVQLPAARTVAPYAGWIGFANVLSDELWRKTPPKPTLH